MFNDDNPISLLDDDKLKRRKFAESLAQAILNYGNENCLTISLMGKWGSGKTSIINMVKDYWIQSNSGNIIVPFDPWYFSNRDDLIFQFFNILSNIQEKDFPEKINVDNLKRLGKSLINITSFSLNMGLASVNFDPEINNENTDGETLLSLKKTLSEEFKKLNQKIIIIIDNIDRLSDKEVSQILMLVKSLADFPNVIYILSFDKDAVVGSLNNLGVHAPEMFLEKIIQIPIVVPEIRKSQLNDLVSNHLGEFYEEYYSGNNLKKDFLDVYSYLRLFFDNLRDLYRYLNIINFYFSVIKDDVNINDFMLILALQLFENEVYNEIKSNPDLFIVPIDNQRDLDKEKSMGDFEKVINSHSKLTEKNMRKVLMKLFPRLEMYYRNIDLNDFYAEWKYDYRICTAEHFYNYFSLNLDNDDLSAASITELLALTDVDEISSKFLEYEKNNHTKELFDIIINRMNDISKENAEYFINSLIDIGDLLHIPINNFLDKRVYLERILEDLLKKYNNNSDRFNVLEQAINNCENSLVVIVEFLHGQDFIYNRFNYKNDREDSSEALIDEKDLDKLEDMTVLKIREWDETDKLWDSYDLEAILYSWEFWDKNIDVNKRVKEFISDEGNALRFAKGFRNINSTILHAFSPPESIQKFKLKSMIKYFDDINDLRSKYIDIYNNELLNDEERVICESLIEQIDKEFI